MKKDNIFEWGKCIKENKKSDEILSKGGIKHEWTVIQLGDEKKINT